MIYKDSTPKLNVGWSAFENWFQQQPFATQAGIKQLCRDSYAAGMGDPLVTYAQPSDYEIHKAHCYQAPYETSCKYGDDDCPMTAPVQAQERCGSCGSANAYITHTCNECGQKIDSVDVRGAQERKPLTNDELYDMYAECPTCDADMIEFARAVEAAHGIKEQP